MQCHGWPADGGSGKPDCAPAVQTSGWSQQLLSRSHRGFYLGCSRSCWALRAWVHCLCRDRKDRAGPEVLESSHTPRCCRRDEDCEKQNASFVSVRLNRAHAS